MKSQDFDSGWLGRKIHPASPNLEFKGRFDIITGTKSPTNLITAYLNRPKIESESETGPEEDFMIANENFFPPGGESEMLVMQF